MDVLALKETKFFNNSYEVYEITSKLAEMCGLFWWFDGSQMVDASIEVSSIKFSLIVVSLIVELKIEYFVKCVFSYSNFVKNERIRSCTNQKNGFFWHCCFDKIDRAFVWCRIIICVCTSERWCEYELSYERIIKEKKLNSNVWKIINWYLIIF